MKLVSNGVYFDRSSKSGFSDRRERVHSEYRAEVRDTITGKRIRKRFRSHGEATRWIRTMIGREPGTNVVADWSKEFQMPAEVCK